MVPIYAKWGDIGAPIDFCLNRTKQRHFFSLNTDDIRTALASVEWTINKDDGSHEILSIDGLRNEYGYIDLSGEMSTAYGTGFPSYSLGAPCTIDLYSVEFDSLLNSYPARETDRLRISALGNEFPIRGGNRLSLSVGLAQSILLAKHLGAPKLKAIRRYYNDLQVPLGFIRRNAFKLLLEQTNDYTPDTDHFWFVGGSDFDDTPPFPYRMQSVALCDKETNWRVLQASAHRDIDTSLAYGGNREPILGNVSDDLDIFEYSSEWAEENAFGMCSVGVVMKTVRTFLPEWIIASSREPIWEPEVPTTCLELELRETRVHDKTELSDDVWL